MKDLALLESVQTAAMRAPEFQPDQPTPGTTHCNAALRRIASAFGYDFPDVMANVMVDILNKDPRWSVANFKIGSSHALAGGLAVLAKKFETHGHVATVMALGMKQSPSLASVPGLDSYVLVVANVGKENGPVLATRAFPVLEPDGTVNVDWSPQCFCLDA